ncbi:MAG: tetratricopeptide repeat protein [Candidatus Rokubacteria bacterium]|nr:tetratricopeptide repeat protein [Candidatus Rokubacteria bacterium]
MTAIVLVALTIGVPALLFVLWPLLVRRDGSRTFLPLPPDRSQQLLEDKRRALRALRELRFEHDAGHVSDEDYADLRARYETDAAAILGELDRLGEGRPRAEPAPPPDVGPRRPAWRHPVTVSVGAVALVGFGVALGAGVVRYTEPDPTAGMAMPGSRPAAAPVVAPPSAGGDAGAPRQVSPETLKGMLEAARASLFAERYGEAIAAYQAVLKRDPENVDAMTHLGLIVAIGGHADSALETFERALKIDPNYPPALLYRGQVLYETKRDVAGAIRSWETFVAVAPAGEDRERVLKMIAEARARPAGPQK